MARLDQLAKKVKSLLLQDVAGPDGDVEIAKAHGLTVFVVSPRFEGLDDMDRQELVWNLLEHHLSPEEQRAVAIVVALTPKERAFHAAATPS